MELARCAEMNPLTHPSPAHPRPHTLSPLALAWMRIRLWNSLCHLLPWVCRGCLRTCRSLRKNQFYGSIPEYTLALSLEQL